MEFSADWTTRVGQLNQYVADQYAGNGTNGTTPEQFIDYLYECLIVDTEYEPEDGDMNVIRKAVERIMDE